MAISACPRCDAQKIVKVADSPIKGKFEVYRRQQCNFVWRSTEKLENVGRLTKQLVDQAVVYYL